MENPLKIFLATWLEEQSQKNALDKIGKYERLLSYYHTRRKLKEFIAYFK